MTPFGRPTNIIPKLICCTIFAGGMSAVDAFSTGVWGLTILSLIMMGNIRYAYTSDVPPHSHESITHATRDRYVESLLTKSEWILAISISICVGGIFIIAFYSSLWGIFPVIIGGYNIASAIQWVQYFARTP